MFSLFTVLLAAQSAITLATDCVEDTSYRAPLMTLEMNPSRASKAPSCKQIKKKEKLRSTYCTLTEVHQACPITCGDCCADIDGLKDGSCADLLKNKKKKKKLCNKSSDIQYNCASSCSGYIKKGMDSCPPYVPHESSPSPSPSVATPALCDDSQLITELEYLISLHDPDKLAQGEKNLKNMLDSMMQPDYLFSELEKEALTHFGVQIDLGDIKKHAHFLIEEANKGAVELCKGIEGLGAANGIRGNSRRLRSIWHVIGDVLECSSAVLGTGVACFASVGALCGVAAAGATGVIIDKTA